MEQQKKIRHATPGDLAALTAIYNHYIQHTSATFDIEPFTTEQRSEWLAKFKPGTPHQCLVLEDSNGIQGYASSSQFRPKAAYDTSVETTIYLAPGCAGQGHGSQLYGALFSALQNQPVHRCYAVITIPNDASIALHRKFGFSEAGRLTEVGYKFDRFWDTVWMEKLTG
ncbi:MAG: N-acetyltransferase [Pseudomonadales bacterium]|nr:N-acetyltransferase [Pseudomonadales bacterium]